MSKKMFSLSSFLKKRYICAFNRTSKLKKFDIMVNQKNVFLFVCLFSTKILRNIFLAFSFKLKQHIYI